ncbi:MAG: hypothetical protein J7M13_01355 [Synergistetes bacterium]|nr:hypothetical protein [Synergistota bacterium]
MKVGVVDIGSNSVRGLLGEIQEGKEFRYMRGDIITTRLGEGLSKSGKLSDEAIYRTLQGVKSLLDAFKRYEVREIYGFATSAVREAKNGRFFLKILRKESGLSVDLLSGEEEALLNLLGVEVGIGIEGSYLLFDIGGGSTEIALKKEEDLILRSFPIGALKIRERFGRELDEACCFLEAFWREEASDLRRLTQGIDNFVGIGGTLSALVLLRKKATSYDIKAVHGETIDILWLYEKLRELKELTLRELELLLPFDPGRAYIFPHGGALLFSLMSFFSACEVKVSETDLLWGALVKRWNVRGFKL